MRDVSAWTARVLPATVRRWRVDVRSVIRHAGQPSDVAIDRICALSDGQANFDRLAGLTASL